MRETTTLTRPLQVFSAALLLGSALSCGPGNASKPATSAASPGPAVAATPVSVAPANPAPTASVPAAPGFEKLTGSWLRQDGGYVLEIRSVSPGGTVDASYLNPRPIRVARAEATRMAESLALLVELRDVNYPGSTYRLTYDPGRDALAGTYFQALQGQTFEVEFVRR